MKITQVYKNGRCLKLAHSKERRTEYRPTWPYYLALIIFAVVLAVTVNKFII